MSLLQDTLPFKHMTLKSFDQFMGNESVIKTLRNPDSMPQFCYIWGENHTGKTHLLEAFVEHLITSNKTHRLFDASAVRQIDVTSVIPTNLQFLVLDDISDLSGSEQSELALFNLFNYCKNNSVNLVVSASNHPKDEIWGLPDLISRLNSGLTCAIKALKGQVALNCITNQFKLNGMSLDHSVIQYLQTHFNSHYPALYRLFLSVSSESLKLKRKVTVPLIKQAIKDSES